MKAFTKILYVLIFGLALLVVSGIFIPAEAQFSNGYDIIFTSDQAGATQLAH